MDQRGPDFLPYQLPDAPVPTPSSRPPAPPSAGRWSTALEALPNVGVVSLAAGVSAAVLLFLISLLAGSPGPGVVVVLIAAATSVITGWIGLRATTHKDARTLIGLGQSLAVVSSVVALVVYASHTDDGPAPITVPSPQATSAPSVPAPTPLPSNGPLPTVPPPSGTFGVPTQPQNSLTDDPADTGTLVGHVVDTAGKPIEGATVTITRTVPGDVTSIPDCPTRVTTQTDAQGVYRQQLCQLGELLGWTVTITYHGATAHASLYVNSGQTTVYDVILPRTR